MMKTKRSNTVSDGNDNRNNLTKLSNPESLVAVPGGECYGNMNKVYGLTCSECVGTIPRLCAKATLRYWKYKPDVTENNEEGMVY
jgi:hypothetical protein